jgi:hypothetical protein
MQTGVKILKNSPRWPWANNQMGNPDYETPVCQNIIYCGVVHL